MSANGNRADWCFTYTHAEIVEAVQRRADYHADRSDWWEGERDKADGELREKGIEYRDRPVTGGVRTEIVMDPEISRRLEEAREKMKRHTDRATEYERWVAVLGRDPTRERDLSIADVVYFGLHPSPEDVET